MYRFIRKCPKCEEVKPLGYFPEDETIEICNECAFREAKLIYWREYQKKRWRERKKKKSKSRPRRKR